MVDERLHIEELLKRFMEGESTLDEERELGVWFRSHEVDESLKPYQQMFAAFDAQYQWSRGITTGISALYTQEERAFVEDIWKERNDVRQKDCFYKYAS